MSSLWTPGGEHYPQTAGNAANPPSPPPGSRPPDSDFLTDDETAAAEAQAQVDAMRAQLANTPAEVVVANHCYGLFELAAIYLSQQPPMLYQAKLAIDGLGYLLTGLKGRLGESESALFESLSQLQLAFVQLEGVERTAAEETATSES
ncbi:MAG TPA: hypothetical protein VGF87_11255 [Acidimicrobiales bacterium]|jgi:hypothetical protein